MLKNQINKINTLRILKFQFMAILAINMDRANDECIEVFFLEIIRACDKHISCYQLLPKANMKK